MHASASVEWQSRERRETRAAGLSNLVPLVTRGHLRVSHGLLDGPRKRETARSLSFCGLFISSV